MPVVGARAPGFSLLDDSGAKVSLSGLRGKRVVLFFYPEDDSPGCTTQACGFRDAFPRFGELDAVVLGISPDSVESHARFKAKFGLPFQLLSDPRHVVASKYGVWGERQLYGQSFVGMTRTTFVVDRAGRVASVHPNVRTEGHAERMLAALRGVE